MLGDRSFREDTVSIIQPRTLKGFRDLMPAQALQRAELIERIATVFHRHGYGPIDTPAIEYAEILHAKGGEDTDKEQFRFVDKGGRDVALRFDLTVPLARFVAQHQGALGLPFRRSHMGPVWRGERPQKGRFREFWQCDADLIGPVSASADAEIIVLMASTYAALDVGQVTIRMNDRRILTGLLEAQGVSDAAVPVLRALDKREKQGDEIVRKEMREAGLADEGIDRLLTLCVPGEDNDATLATLEAASETDTGRAGVDGLRDVLALCAAANVPSEAILIDPSIARGLDYYTGIVMEARFDALPDIGSVGSGGRYDDLAGHFSKQQLPGVGCSIGIDRLLAALEETGAGAARETPSEVLVTAPQSGAPTAEFAFAADLRSAGVSVEVYPDSKKHGQQMRYADRKRIPFVVTRNEDGTWYAKRMSDGATATCPDAMALATWLRG